MSRHVFLTTEKSSEVIVFEHSVRVHELFSDLGAELVLHPTSGHQSPEFIITRRTNPVWSLQLLASHTPLQTNQILVNTLGDGGGIEIR